MACLSDCDDAVFEDVDGDVKLLSYQLQGRAGCDAGDGGDEAAGSLLTYLLLGGAVLYLAVVITEHFSSTSGSRLTQAFFITAVVITLLIRIVRVWNLWRDPRKLNTGATRVRDA